MKLEHLVKMSKQISSSYLVIYLPVVKEKNKRISIGEKDEQAKYTIIIM